MEADGGFFYINRLAIHQWAYPKNLAEIDSKINILFHFYWKSFKRADLASAPCICFHSAGKRMRHCLEMAQ
jgi:hypothetical protein